MKKKLKLNKKTIAELSGTDKIAGGAATKLACLPSKAQPCVTFPCDISLNVKCNTSIVDACPTRICISDIECNSKDGNCIDTIQICIQ